MPIDLFAVAVAASFTMGCASIHALQRHAELVTLVLAVLAYGLLVAVGWMLAIRAAAMAPSNPTVGWVFVAAGAM